MTKINEIKDFEQLYNSLHDNWVLLGKSGGFTYIIRPVDKQGRFIGDLCKIGKTSKNVEKYVDRRIYPRSPYELKIIAKIRGRYWEKIFHIKFDKFRKHHEWFKFTEEMLELIRFLEEKGYKVKE